MKMPKKSSSHLKNGSRRSNKVTEMTKRGPTDLRFASSASASSIKSISDETSNTKRDHGAVAAAAAPTKIVSKTECVLPPVNSTITSSSRTYAEVVAEVEPSLPPIGKSQRRQLSAPPSQSELDYWDMVADACADVLHKIDAQSSHQQDPNQTETSSGGWKDFQFQDWLLTYAPRNDGKNPWDSEEDDPDDWIHVADKSAQCKI